MSHVSRKKVHEYNFRGDVPRSFFDYGDASLPPPPLSTHMPLSLAPTDTNTKVWAHGSPGPDQNHRNWSQNSHRKGGSSRSSWGGGELGAGCQPRVPPKTENSTDLNPLFLGWTQIHFRKRVKKTFWELYDAPFLGFFGGHDRVDPPPPWIRQCNRLELTKPTKPLAVSQNLLICVRDDTQW